MTQPQEVANRIEAQPELPSGEMERFIGYGVMAQPFASGHILALRRFSATSVGPAYTAVWHRDPTERWTFYITGEPHQCCNRYFGSEVTETHRCEISLDWSSPRQLSVTVGDSIIQWEITLASTPITRMMNASCPIVPDTLWRRQPVLAMMGKVAGGSLRCGRMALHGAVPNGQWFVANPPLLWMVDGTSATIEGDDPGSPAPLRVQDRLGDFWLPQRGLFFAGSILFELYDSARHNLVATRAPSPATGAG